MKKKVNDPIITQEGNCYYLTLDLKDLSNYDKAKVVHHFINRDTEILELYIDNEIRRFLARYGIVASLTDKEDIEVALNKLRREYHKDIKIHDLYKGMRADIHIHFVGMSKNLMTVVLEDDRYLQCGIEVEYTEVK